MVWLPPLAREAAVASVVIPVSRERKAYQAAFSSAARREPARRQRSGSERSAPSAESATPASPEIDWHAELGPAAERQLAREAEERKRLGAPFTCKRPVLLSITHISELGVPRRPYIEVLRWNLVAKTASLRPVGLTREGDLTTSHFVFQSSVISMLG